MILISATRFRLRSPLYLPLVVWHSYQSSRQASRASGFLGGKLLADAKGAFWTLTAWEGKAGMAHYRNTNAHQRAMPVLSMICDEAAVVRWQQETADLPNWKTVHQRMMTEGRFTPIAHPSQAQIDRTIAAPVVGRLREQTIAKLNQNGLHSEHHVSKHNA